MSKAAAVTIAVEGASDAAVLTRLLRDHAIDVHQALGFKGKGYLDTRLNAYNEAAKYGAWLVVRDLDRDDACAVTLAKRLLPYPSGGMIFRVAVRAIESWLLADAKGVVKFFRVGLHSVPTDPESLHDPKKALVDVARRSSTRAIREDMVPADGTTAAVGPGFVGRVVEFARTDWNWKRAAARSESLRSCVARIAAEWK